MTDMLSFNAVVHARPKHAHLDAGPSLRGLLIQRLETGGDVVGPGFPRSFEEVGESLETLERMFFEPDGSFVWVGSAEGQAWQLDGLLADRAGRLLYVELKGRCPPEVLDRILATFGRPEHGLMFQLVREAVFLDESEFRKYAAAGD
ncbi:MAG: hypothetical protein J0M17_05615 [Planctomycetes bacterium]|nr:hypothetical protein [Planctomycetota bacterium]